METHPFRPIFTNLKDALVDANEFHKYGDEKEHKYHGRVFRVGLYEIQKQHSNNLIKRLTKENAELRAKLEQLQTEQHH